MKKEKPEYRKNITKLTRKDYASLVDIALIEDKVQDDITSQSIFGSQSRTKAVLIAREEGILCGSEIFKYVFKKIDPKTKITFKYKDGNLFKKNSKIAVIEGRTIGILSAERTALNFLSMLSGISTKTASIVKILDKMGIGLLDTRKTLPAYRILSKYAVSTGGGKNHRLDLEDMGLIKDNHISTAGSVRRAIDLFRKVYPKKKLEVEVETIEQLKDALTKKPEILMLDNMNPQQLKESVKIIKKFNRENKTSIFTEASGGYNPKNLDKLKGSQVDFVSMGNLTNEINPLDFSLEIEISP